jgi:hypothetical protein
VRYASPALGISEHSGVDTFDVDDLICPRCDSTHPAVECLRERVESVHRMACLLLRPPLGPRNNPPSSTRLQRSFETTAGTVEFDTTRQGRGRFTVSTEPVDVSGFRVLIGWFPSSSGRTSRTLR